LETPNPFNPGRGIVLIQDGKEQMLRRQIFVLELRCDVLRGIQLRTQRAGKGTLDVAAIYFGEFVHQLPEGLLRLTR
jgi:hypothetical protein